MTLQEAFDKIWDWFIVQKKPRATDGLFCRLRTKDGNKCAIGVLIPDDAYIPDMDRGEPLQDVLNDYPSLREYMPTDCTDDQLARLQRCHDTCFGNNDFTQQMNIKLSLFAYYNNLIVPQTA